MTGGRPATLVGTEAARIRAIRNKAIGTVPLVAVVGACSESRNVLGVMIFSGVTGASFLTLFVVPAFYHPLARRTGSPEAVARDVERLSEGA